MHAPIALDRRELGTARDHDSLVELLRARKEELGLSNEFVDDIGGLAVGHAAKILGPARVKTLGRFSLDVLLEVLACSLVLVADPAKLRRTETRYEGRDQGKVHAPKDRIAKGMIDRVKPVLFSELGRRGADERNRCLAAKHRSRIARKAARARWRNGG
jgi:hypothetical protein